MSSSSTLPHLLDQVPNGAQLGEKDDPHLDLLSTSQTPSLFQNIAAALAYLAAAAPSRERGHSQIVV